MRHQEVKHTDADYVEDLLDTVEQAQEFLINQSIN